MDEFQPRIELYAEIFRYGGFQVNYKRRSHCQNLTTFVSDFRRFIEGIVRLVVEKKVWKTTQLLVRSVRGREHRQAVREGRRTR